MKKRSPPNKKPERNREILKLRAQGRTLEEIGARFGIPYERVGKFCQTRAKGKGNMSEGCNFGKKSGLLAMVLLTGLPAG